MLRCTGCSVGLQELGERSVGDYVTLPAKKYSVLDSEAVKKLGDNKFRVSGGQQKFPMGQSGEPVGVRSKQHSTQWQLWVACACSL